MRHVGASEKNCARLHWISESSLPLDLHAKHIRDAPEYMPVVVSHGVLHPNILEHHIERMRGFLSKPENNL